MADISKINLPNGTTYDIKANVANKVGTSNVGHQTRPIYLSSGTPTVVDWYPAYCTIYGGNKANYPWHRFAQCTTTTGNYVDRDAVIVLHGRYNLGQYGLIKVSVRTNGAGTSKNVSATWIVRYGFKQDDVIISNPTASTGTDETISVYVKCGTYPRMFGYVLNGSNNGWSLVSSNEANDTTSTDPKTSIEVYATVSGVTEAADGGQVAIANTLGTSDIGSNIKPIYLDDGVPKECSYTIKKNVPADAVFTDTTYSSLPASSGGTDVSLVTTGEKYTWNDAENTVKQNTIPTNSTDETTYSMLFGKSGATATKEAYKQNTVFTYTPYDPVTTGPLLNLIGLIGDAIFKTDIVKAKTFIGIDNEITLPHKYSTNEQVVGYWTDGSPIYEKTISYSTTISSGGNITVPTNLWSQKAQPIDIVLYSTSGTSKLVWRFVTAQVNSSGVLQIFNGRAATLTFDTFTIQYVKLT